jgi:hypothetical protein
MTRVAVAFVLLAVASTSATATDLERHALRVSPPCSA